MSPDKTVPGTSSGQASRDVIARLAHASSENRNRLPMLDSIFERFEFMITGAFRHLTAVNVESAAPEISSAPFGDIVDSLPAPCFSAVAKASEWDSHILIAFDAPFAYSMIDILMGGGAVTASERGEGRAPTSIERRLAQRLVNLALESLSDAFEPVTEVKFEFERMETSAQLTPICQPGDNAMQVAVPLGVEGRDQGKLMIVIPYDALDTVRSLLAGSFMGGRRDRDGEWSKHFKNTFQETPVELSAVLTEGVVDFHEVLSWEVGGVIEMPADAAEPATIICDGVELFRGRVGRRNNNLAVRIEIDLTEGDEGPEDVDASA